MCWLLRKRKTRTESAKLAVFLSCCRRMLSAGRSLHVDTRHNTTKAAATVTTGHRREPREGGRAIYYVKYPREGWNLGGGRKRREGLQWWEGITHLSAIKFSAIKSCLHPWFAISTYVFYISLRYDYITTLNMFQHLSLTDSLHGNYHGASNFLAEATISLAFLFAPTLFCLSRHPFFFALC